MIFPTSHGSIYVRLSVARVVGCVPYFHFSNTPSSLQQAPFGQESRSFKMKPVRSPFVAARQWVLGLAKTRKLIRMFLPRRCGTESISRIGLEQITSFTSVAPGGGHLE